MSFHGVRQSKQEGGRLWDFPFQGRPREYPTVKRGKEEACATEYLVAGRWSTGTHLGTKTPPRETGFTPVC